MTDAITLSLGQTASPGKCGSCHRFERFTDSTDLYGSCEIKLPPWVDSRNNTDHGGGRDWRRVKDTAGCDLHRHTGASYIVSQLVTP